MPVMLIDTVDLYHYIPLLVVYSLAGGHKVNKKQNLLRLFSCTVMVMKVTTMTKLCFFSDSLAVLPKAGRQDQPENSRTQLSPAGVLWP